MMKRIGELMAENARLKAEVKQLMIFCNCTLIPSKELQAEVERLTKAGDAMATGLQGMAGERPKALADEWHDAKEGKQS
jgi:hypothetical protein